MLMGLLPAERSDDDEFTGIISMGSGLWWGRMVLILVLALFFLAFGIENLIAAFHLKNPLEFIVSFFSASLMVLLSMVGVIYPVLQVHAYLLFGKSHTDEK